MTRTVLHLTGMRSTKYGGMERYLVEVARQSATRDFRTVIQYQEAPRSHAYVEALTKVGGQVILEEMPASVVRGLRVLVRLVSAVRPGIIQTHFLPEQIMPVVCPVGRFFGVERHLAMVHSPQSHRYAIRNRLSYYFFDEILPVSNAVGAGLISDGVPREKVITNYMGLIDSRGYSEAQRVSVRQELGIPTEALVFGTIAFDSPLKGMDVLMQAFERFLRFRPDAHLIQLGVDPKSSTLARRYANNSRIHWLGIRDDAAFYLSAIDVYVQPSRSEGLPLAIMEAMAMRRPVLATSAGGIPEAVCSDVSGVLVASDDVDALIGGMRMIGAVDAGPMRTEMGIAGYSRFQRLFDGRTSVTRLVDRYVC